MSRNNKGLRLEDIPPEYLARLTEEERVLAARQRAEKAFGTRLIGLLSRLDKRVRRKISAKTTVPGLWIITTAMLVIWIVQRLTAVTAWGLGYVQVATVWSLRISAKGLWIATKAFFLWLVFRGRNRNYETYYRPAIRQKRRGRRLVR
jgi:hypothetical protein